MLNIIHASPVMLCIHVISGEPIVETFGQTKTCNSNFAQHSMNEAHLSIIYYM